MTYTVRQTVEEEWQALRRVRLAALADAPLAFWTRLEEAQAYPDSRWQERARPSPTLANYLAWCGGDAVGMTGVFVEGEQAEVVGVWVHPQHRRHGVARAMLSAAVVFGRRAGSPRATLWVARENHRARALYERLGFHPTGRTKQLPWDESVVEEEMELPLRPEDA